MMRVLYSLFIAALLFPNGRAFSQSKDSQLKFEIRKILLGGKTITVEIADTPEKRAFGLMYRESLKPDQGMLFIFDREEPLAFWMKNTLIPLSIGYFDKKRALVDIQEMVPATAGELSPTSYPSKKDAQYALEMAKGWFAKSKLKIGTKFSFVPEQKPSR